EFEVLLRATRKHRNRSPPRAGRKLLAILPTLNAPKQILKSGVICTGNIFCHRNGFRREAQIIAAIGTAKTRPLIRVRIVQNWFQSSRRSKRISRPILIDTPNSNSRHETRLSPGKSALGSLLDFKRKEYSICA